MELTERVARLEAKLDHLVDHLLPTLVTKADLKAMRSEFHEALHAQTWKLIGAALTTAALVVASLRLLH